MTELDVVESFTHPSSNSFHSEGVLTLASVTGSTTWASASSSFTKSFILNRLSRSALATTGSILDSSRHVRDQRCPLKLQQSFVPAHPGTPAARQHKSGAQHERIIALPTGSTISFTRADVFAAILRNEPVALRNGEIRV